MVSPGQLVLFFNLILVAASQDPHKVNLTLLTDIVNCASKYHQFNVIHILAAQRTMFEIEEFIISLRSPIQTLTVVRPNTSFPFTNLDKTLTIAFFWGDNEKMYTMTDTFTRGRRLACVLFVLTFRAMTHRETHRILKHAWSKNYMRAILLYRDYQGQDCLVSYNVYDNFRMKNVIDDYRVLDVFNLKPLWNTDQYQIQSPAKVDTPRVFEVTSFKGGKLFFSYRYKLFMAYVQYMYATFEEYHMRDYGSTSEAVFTDISNMITDGVIEISLHQFNRPQATEVQSSYPILLSDICVMMPMINEVPSYMFLKRPFHFGVWLLVVFGTIYLSMLLMLVPANSSDTRREFGWSFLQGLGYMLNNATWAYKYNVTWRYFSVHMAAWILGFIVVTWYCAILNGYWATTAFGTQIDTIEDFLTSDLNILVTNEELDVYLRLQHLPEEFKKRLIPVDLECLARHRTAFNTTFAYMISTDRWQFLNLQQQHSRRPSFRLSNICVQSHIISFQMEYDSRLAYSVKNLILYVEQSGLLNYWMQSSFRYAAREGYVSLMTNSYDVERLRYTDLLLAFWMLAIGAGASAVVFVLELRLERLQRWWRRMMVHIAEWGKKQVDNNAEM